MGKRDPEVRRVEDLAAEQQQSNFTVAIQALRKDQNGGCDYFLSWANK
jgi:hypothetical protein